MINTEFFSLFKLYRMETNSIKTMKINKINENKFKNLLQMSMWKKLYIGENNFVGIKTH